MMTSEQQADDQILDSIIEALQSEVITDSPPIHIRQFAIDFGYAGVSATQHDQRPAGFGRCVVHAATIAAVLCFALNTAWSVFACDSTPVGWIRNVNSSVWCVMYADGRVEVSDRAPQQ